MFWVDIVIFVVFCPNDHKSLWPLCDYTCATYDMVKAVFRKLFFFYLDFFSRTFVIHRTAGEEEAISLTPSYHLHLLRRHLDINPAITAESSPLHIASSWTEPGAFDSQIPKACSQYPSDCKVSNIQTKFR